MCIHILTLHADVSLRDVVECSRVDVLDRGGMRHTADHMSALTGFGLSMGLGLTKRSCFSRFRAPDMVVVYLVENDKVNGGLEQEVRSGEQTCGDG
jgi:hypothetical protein